jgi:hypothetical protein
VAVVQMVVVGEFGGGGGGGGGAAGVRRGFGGGSERFAGGGARSASPVTYTRCRLCTRCNEPRYTPERSARRL